MFHILWLYLGDFNEIEANHEYEGLAGRAQWKMNNFKEASSDAHLSNLGFIGPQFTWWNKTSGQGSVRARLDKGLTS